MQFPELMFTVQIQQLKHRAHMTKTHCVLSHDH